MNKRSTIISLSLAIFVAAFCMYKFVDSGKTNGRIVPTTSTSRNSIPDSPGNTVAVPGKTSPELSCQQKILEKIAGSCDEHCMLEEAERNDPEVVKILQELKNLSSQHMKPITRLGRFQKIFGDNIESDPVKREQMLRDLVKEDSDNAYPIFFLAALIDENENEKRALIKEGLQRKKYESYYVEFRRRLQRATIDRPEIYARGFLSYGQLNLFHINASYLTQADDPYKDLYEQIALKILRPTFEHKGEFGDLLWDREDYVMARSLLEDSDPTENSLHPEYMVEDQIFDRFGPGLFSEECSVRSFMSAREKIKAQLRLITGK